MVCPVVSDWVGVADFGGARMRGVFGRVLGEFFGGCKIVPGFLWFGSIKQAPHHVCLLMRGFTCWFFPSCVFSR